ncbi:MAG: sensor histidine kinase [Luteolibacter sp.]
MCLGSDIPTTRYISWLLVILLAGQFARAADLLDSIARVRALPPEEAALHVPAVIEATVTFYNPVKNNCLVHDGHNGVFVTLLDDPAIRPGIKVGTRLRIKGVTQPGDFVPSIEGREITVLGDGPLPEPRHIDGSELFTPSLDCQWVQVSAIIVGNSGTANITLVAEVSGWTFMVHFPDNWNDSERAAKLMQRPVTIRGVVGSLCNDQRQLTSRYLFVTSVDQIVPTETATLDHEPPLRKINELLRSDATSQSFVRVRGTVTHAASDGLYLRGESGSLLVRTAITSGFTPGMRVEAEGFPAIAMFRPVLRASRVTILDRAAPPLPEPLDLTGIRLIRQQAELVTLDADLLTRRDGPDDEVILQCRADKWFFEARLPNSRSLPTDLFANDHLKIVGICELTNTQPLAADSLADGFRIQVRNAADITVLRRASWWTLPRLLWALAVVAALALVSLLWVAQLRLHVETQTKIISKQIEQTAVNDERQRVARELHDTIEQELAGLSIQLSNARQRLARAPDQADTALDLAQRMLRHCREEARTSIRDLRSVALDQHGLAGALEEFLEPLAVECGAKFVMEERGKSAGPTGHVALHLLRIAQEAAANAARHAHPREIRLLLEHTDDALIMEIRDDGLGFNPDAPAPRGHFGVLGIRERANKLHATLAIESAPGSGTTIRVVVPSLPRETNENP